MISPQLKSPSQTEVQQLHSRYLPKQQRLEGNNDNIDFINFKESSSSTEEPESPYDDHRPDEALIEVEAKKRRLSTPRSIDIPRTEDNFNFWMVDATQPGRSRTRKNPTPTQRFSFDQVSPFSSPKKTKRPEAPSMFTLFLICERQL